MARVKLSSLVTSVNGSIGKLTFSGSGSSATVRSKPYNSHFNDANQHAFLRYRQAAYAAWMALSRADQLFVENFVSLNSRYQLASGGISKSAQFHYIKWYMYLLAAGVTPTLSHCFDPPVTDPTVDALTIYGSDLNVELSAPLDPLCIPILFLSRNRASIVQSRCNDVTYLPYYNQHGDQYFYVAPSYLSRFGLLPQSGTYVWVGVYAINPYDLHMSNYFIAPILV